jgi:DNA polymerase III alpha subunit
MKKIENIFKANPKADKVYVTTDNTPFLKESHAANHQAELNRKAGKKLEYKTYTKGEKHKQSDEKDFTKAEVCKQAIGDGSYVEETYENLLLIAKTLEIDVKGKSKQDHLDAIKNWI